MGVNVESNFTFAPILHTFALSKGRKVKIKI